MFNQTIFEARREYNHRFLYPFEPHTIDIQLSEWKEHAESINPQNRLYAICIHKDDYLVVDDQNTKKTHLFRVDTIYCFLTYNPIPEVFFNLILSIFNQTATQRKGMYLEVGEGCYQKVDFDSIQNCIFSQTIKSNLSNLHQLKVPSFENSLRYPFYDSNVLQWRNLEYSCSNQQSAYLELALWNSYKVFSILSLRNIQLILGAILQEKVVIFFSEDETLLTAALNTFIGLLFPFKYPFKIISGGNSHTLHHFDAPFPTMMSFNRKEEYFLRKGDHGKS